MNYRKRDNKVQLISSELEFSLFSSNSFHWTDHLTLTLVFFIWGLAETEWQKSSSGWYFRMPLSLLCALNLSSSRRFLLVLMALLREYHYRSILRQSCPFKTKRTRKEINDSVEFGIEDLVCYSMDNYVYLWVGVVNTGMFDVEGVRNLS